MRKSLFAHRGKSGLRVVKNATAPTSDPVEVMLYDEIGFFGVTAKEFVQELQGITAESVRIRINSPGGDVFEGVAIANAIKAHPSHIITQVDGVAASISSVIAIAGDTVRMAENAFLMIHKPWAFAMGNADEFRKLADTLDKVDTSSLLAAYVDKSGETPEQVAAWMKDETWFTAQEAMDHHFTDEIGTAESLAMAAQFDFSVFSKMPETLVAALQEETVPPIRVVERSLRDAGFSRSDAKRMAALAVQGTPRDADVMSALDKMISTLKSE